MRILIVDDSMVSRVKAREALKVFEDVEFVEAANGEEAIPYLTVPDHIAELVILDTQMPEMNGHELLEIMKGHNIRIPVIMVTAEQRKNEVVKALNLGAKNYLSKPYTAKMLADKVESVMAAVGGGLKRRIP